MSGIVRLPSAVLFACSLNAVRSPMAEALMRQLQGQRIYVQSVGLRAGESDPFVAEVMREVGCDLSHHRSQTFDELDDDYFDLIVTLSPEAHHRALEMTRTMACEVEFWPTLDATAVEGSRDVRLEAYRSVREAIARRIRQRFPPPPEA